MSCNPTLDRARKLQQLHQAEDAYHTIRIGGGVREFYDQNGERIVYSAANPASLLVYINTLRGELGLPYFGGPVQRPAGVFL